MPIRRPKANKNPPIFSHEFIIINHADILSFISMIFIVGLLFQVTNPIASPFVMLQHNVTSNDTSVPIQYETGLSDLLTISFYFLLSIIIHAVIQEYILDKQNKRLRLSKVKHSKFNESGQLLFFYLTSAVTAFYIISNEHYLTNISSLWSAYPHLEMSYLMKYYFIAQLSYWIHFYPELYFQKVKKDEIMPRITYITLHLVFIAAAYILSLQRLTIVLLALHYTTESLFHFSRLVYFSEKQPIANVGFSIWNITYVAVRLISITLATLTLWYGLGKVGEDGKPVMANIKRMCSLGSICLTQAWLMWHFINFHLRRRHVSERISSSVSQQKSKKLH